MSKLKTYKTWCVVLPNGNPRHSPEMRGTTKRQVQQWLESGQRIARVEVREVTRKKGGRK